MAESASGLILRMTRTFDAPRDLVFKSWTERERLIRLMGLWGGDLAFKLPDTLPSMPRRPQVLPAVESEAVRRRVDIQIARLELELKAARLQEDLARVVPPRRPTPSPKKGAK